jgi:peroxiredoxin
MRLRRVLERFGIVILAVMYLASAACTTARAVKSPKTAPGFALNDSQGVPIRLSDYKGKVVLLNFWATWCHGCVLEVPWFIEFQERYKDSGLSVIGVSMDEGWKPVKAFVEEKRVNYPVVIGNEDLGKLYGLNSMPMTLLIDRSGEIAASYTGVVDKGICESKLRTLLQENAQKATK